MNPDLNDSLRHRLSTTATALCELLLASNRKIVFAESCTGGKMAAAITEIPGISACFCGSTVTYREDAKTHWLSVDPEGLRIHSAESTFATESMAKGVADITPEADCSIAITGHLGPGVDPKIDGIVYVAVSKKEGKLESLVCEQFSLVSPSRRHRQTEAACIAFELAIQELNAKR